MHIIGGLILLILIGGGCYYALSSRIQRSGGLGGQRGSAPRTAGGRAANRFLTATSPRHIKAGARAEAHKVWEKARAMDWLEQQRHNRKHGVNGTGTGPVHTTGWGPAPTATAAPPRRKVLGIPLGPFKPGSTPGGNGTDGVNGGTGTGASTPPPGANGTPGNGNGAQPPATPGTPATTAPPAPPNGTAPKTPPSPTTAPGGTPMAGTSTASAEKLVEGINEIHTHAANGNIHAKREAVAAIHEAAVRFASMVQMLARTMSEPGNHYGPEITEPLAKSGTHLTAAAMTASEADSSLQTLANMTLGAMPGSGRQAPHHGQLTESGTAA